MRKKLLPIACMLSSISIFSQIVNEQVTFDHYTSATNNDLTQKFLLNTTNYFFQSNTGGITGGAIIPPNEVSWGNDIVRYCSTYKNTLNSLIETSVSFKFSSSLLDVTKFQREAVIWLEPGDNRSVGFYVGSYNQYENLLSVNSYGYGQFTYIPNFVNGHWYKMNGQYKLLGGANGGDVFAKVEIFDLGLSGTETPVSVGVHTANFNDPVLAGMDHFEVELAGAKWGGSEYLDNFTISGEKFGNICNNLSAKDIDVKNKLSAFPIPSKDIINILNPKNGAAKVEIFDMSGKLLIDQHFGQTENYIAVPIEKLFKGNYMYKIGNQSSKFIKD